MAEDPLAMPEHAPEYVEAICMSGHYDNVSRFYELADGRRFVLPLIRLRGVGGVGGCIGSYLPGWGCGGLVGRDCDSSVVRAVVDDIRRLGASRIMLRPDPLRAQAWIDVAGSDVVRLPRRAHVVDLAGGVDAMWTRLPKSTRRGIRTAQKRGVRVEVDREGRLLPLYHRLHVLSVDRWARCHHEPVVLARLRAARVDPLIKFDAMAKCLGDSFRLYVAFVDDRPAAALITLIGRTAVDKRNCMDRDLAGPVRANELLTWTAMTDACNAGCTVHHLGESGTSASLAQFKERFGARPIDHVEYRIERIPITRLNTVLRTGVKRLIGFREG